MAAVCRIAPVGLLCSERVNPTCVFKEDILEVKLLREPLVQFFFIGAAIYLAFGLFAEPADDLQDNTLVVDAGEIEWMATSWYKRWNRMPTAQELDGLSAMQTDVLLHIELKDGITHSAILRPGSPQFTIPMKASKLEVAVSYWRMGVIHILEGIDHLLFVLALLLVVSGFMPLLKAVTAFTVAHSITLALATLGFVHVPSKPTEAIIALSIVFLAAEIIHKRNGQVGLTERYPWMIAFVFGLFHGLGFAGALTEIGVPQHEVRLALIMFNVGVETGQLFFIAGVISLMALLRRLPLAMPQGAWRLVPYSIGGVAAFWTIDRIMSFAPLAVWPAKSFCDELSK